MPAESPGGEGRTPWRRYEFGVSWKSLSFHPGVVMLARIALASVLAAVPLLAQQEEVKPKVPKDSVMAVITGCIKGRVIRAADVRQTDTTSGVNITGHTFRISGKKDVMNAVKEYDGDRVEMTGLIKKSTLIEPGVKFKGGRIIVGGGASGGTGALPSPAENVVVIDALTVTQIGGSCES